MQYEGTLYRPPSEARSLIIQVTIGCAHNRCTFCNMYREKKFRVREKEEIMRDLDECRAYYGPMVRRVFFADGDALVVKTELLLELLDLYFSAFTPSICFDEGLPNPCSSTSIIASFTTGNVLVVAALSK